MTSRDVKVAHLLCLGPIITEMAGDTDSVTTEHLDKMAPEVSKSSRDPERSRS